MPAYIAELTLKIGGSDAPDEVLENIQQVVVEESLHLPSMATLVIFNPYQPGGEEEDFFKYGTKAYKDLLAMGEKIEVSLGRSTTESTEFEEDKSSTLFKGEITAIETHFTADSQAPIVVRAYDVTHRLHRGCHNRSFQNMSDTDIVKKIIGEVGLSAGTVDDAGGPYGYGDINDSKGYVFQHNQTNMAFMQMLANRNGFECFVQDDKFHFRKPKSERTLNLTWLQTLSSFSVRVSSAEQVKEVEVRGWDYAKKEVVTETISKDEVLTENSAYGKGAESSQKFSGQPPTPSMIVVDQPFAEAKEAKAIAQSLFNELSGEYIAADAKAEGNPEIRPGKSVELKDLGPYTGKYYITETRHTYQGRLYTTEFSVRGLRGNDIFSMMAGQATTRPPASLMVGIVTDNVDPKKWGRVRVKLPALTEEHTTYWARVVGVGAGSNRGFDCLPEINDEVLVGFEQGDIHRPYVIGGVWNGKDAPPATVDDSVADGKVRLRTFKTRLGHTLQFVEEDKGAAKQGVYLDTVKGHKLYLNDSDQFIETKTADGHQIRLDDKNKKVLIKTSGGQQIEMADNAKSIKISGGNTIELSANTKITLKVGAANIELTTTDVNIKGINVKSNATATAEFKAAAGPVTIKGLTVGIN
ncbi:MAG: VgrG-related protein [Leptolyngbya sp. RL_3_1]|nr:VgrG-related protein [Leptolyngbya sp. RL_3_1]